jgi:dipeptidyl aminopeptidase/acylaminoacyl peptidase
MSAPRSVHGRLRPLAAAFATALLLCWATAASATLPPVAAFGTTPVVDNVTLSEDGRLLASSINAEQVSIVVLDRSVRKIIQRVNFDQNLKLRGMFFVDDKTLIATFSITVAQQGDQEEKSEVGAVFAINPFDGSSIQLLEAKTNNRIYPGNAGFVSRYGAAPGEVLMSALILENAAAGASPDSATLSLVSVNTSTGKWRIVEKGSRNTSSFLVDQGGKVRARIENFRKEQRKVVRAKRGEDWVQVYEDTDPDFGLLGLSADGEAVLGLGPRGGARERLWTIPFDGSGPKVLFEDPEHDVEGVVRDVYDRSLKGVRLGGLEQRLQWLDKQAEARVKSVAAAMPGRRIEIAGYTRDGRYVLAYAVSRSHPGVYMLVDFQSNRAEIVGQEYPQLAKVPLGESRNITYAARDGYKVPAYLTLPPGREAKGLPLVVLPHGGPRARDSGYAFDWWAQFLASRGYAVLQPQFRGSTGFGEAHMRAGDRQWGQVMQHEGVADKSRVCIAGASYGGYAALAGASFTPDLYACSISVAGVSDLVEMLRWEENRYGLESGVVKFWRQHIGKPTDPDVAQYSPARGVAAVRAPVMLMHGVDDTVVPYVQSEFMETALKKAGKPHEVYKLTNEDHWLSRSPSRIEMLSQMDRFLGAHLGPGGRVTIEQPAIDQVSR